MENFYTHVINAILRDGAMFLAASHARHEKKEGGVCRGELFLDFFWGCALFSCGLFSWLLL